MNFCKSSRLIIYFIKNIRWYFWHILMSFRWKQCMYLKSNDDYFSRMHKFIATLSRNWYCWWCCFDTFLINILEMSILSKWSYFEKSQLTYKQLFLCVKKWFQKLKIYIVFSLNIWFFYFYFWLFHRKLRDFRI